MPAERLVIPFTMAVMILAAACSEEGAGKKAFNSPCSASSDCADKVCHKGVCANLQPVDNGQPCQSAASCRSFVCSGGKCVPGKSSAGQACLNREECTSLLCTQGKCGPVKGPADGGVDGGKPDRGRDLAHAKDKGMLPDKLTDAPPWADIPKGTQCKVPKDCDDGLGCTTEACLNGYCKITLNADRCLFGATLTCYKTGDKKSGDPCRQCRPKTSTAGWTPWPGSGCVSTVFGSTYGSTDGPVVTAKLKKPVGVALDGLGNVYIADGNNKVRLLSGGKVSTLAPGVTFSEIADVAVDSTGSIVYVIDRSANKIKTIIGGKVAVLAGSGNPGLKNGLAKNAEFKKPRGIAVDSKGRVYVADTENHVIRRIYAGQVSTLAGTGSYLNCVDGAKASATFWRPHGIAVDSQFNLYVADTYNYIVRKLTASTGIVSTIGGKCHFGDYKDGKLADSRFRHIYDVDVDPSGKNVYVMDRYNHRIRLISGGVISTLAGSGGVVNGGGGSADGPLLKAMFNDPQGLAFGAKGIYVADWDNHRLRLAVP